MKTKKLLLSMAAVMLIQIAGSNILQSLRTDIVQQLSHLADSKPSETKELYEQLNLLNNISSIFDFLWAIPLLILIICFIGRVGKPWQHNLLWGGVSLYIISHLFLDGFSLFFLRGESVTRFDTHTLITIQSVNNITLCGAFLLFTSVIAASIPHRLVRWGLPGISAGMLLVQTGLWSLVLLGKHSDAVASYPSLPLFWRSSWLLLQGSFLISCLWSGLRGVYDTEEQRITRHGDLLRRLIKLCLVRVTISVISVLTLMLGLKWGGPVDFLFTTFTMLSVLCGGVILYTLVALARRWPDVIGRSRSLNVVISCVVLALVGELAILPFGIEFFGLVAKMKAATSFWGMPSLSRIETLQATITWGGRGIQLIGFIATLSLLQTLRGYTQYTDQPWLTQRTSTATRLLFTSAILSVLIYTLIEVRGINPLILLLVGLAGLGIAICFLVVFCRFAFEIAASMDRQDESEEGTTSVRKRTSAP